MTMTSAFLLVAALPPFDSNAALPPYEPNISSAPNMNGEYLLSPTPKGQQVQKLFPTQYKDYPNGVEHFDVYSPEIHHVYSQVFWKGLPPVDLPPEVVRRYAGRGMAVVGFEMDQVLRGRTSGEDLSLPITHAYNHHFESTMVGSKSTLDRVSVDAAHSAAPPTGRYRCPFCNGFPRATLRRCEGCKR